MTTSELQMVESLLFQALPDPRGFADRLMGQLVERLATEPAPSRPVTVVDASTQQLSDTCLLLAAALGACECWGREPGCEVCAGAGSPGWTDPDEDLYRELVLPAVRRRAGTGTGSTDGRPQRTADEEGVQR
ncbi:hypothetical protein E9549_19995 [Blastococcus sp. MG754426]|uniref:hypothetical protein n=1 Tax=unclassified Blastococcus TaxID=2619396 RepID=UPI001EF04A34|nr:MULTISPECIES: hypothetical protein [unclassified Blastococcus]MCF6509657.1 hypothetical protein [Blastococcus sp. MG754426]MCF6510720.1 hypothetical protein [Blastococcus sp. MG754427]